MKYAYIVVEGPHDVEFVARLLKPDFHRIKDFEKLDAGWRHLVPTKFPHRGDLLGRVPIPTFLQSETHSVALHSAQGIDNITRMLEESWLLLSVNRVAIDSVGIVLDADDGKLPAIRHGELRGALATPRLNALSWPVDPGVIAPGSPRCGVFILPDNHNAGTLEDLLVEASENAYPGLHTRATAFVDQVAPNAAALGLVANDLKELRKPAGARKATVACVANLLRPGKSITVAIQDCRWLDPAAVGRGPRLAPVQDFVHRLLNL